MIILNCGLDSLRYSNCELLIKYADIHNSGFESQLEFIYRDITMPVAPQIRGIDFGGE